MKIADLNQPLSSQGCGQLRYGKRSLDDLHPVGFDAPGIESSRHSRTDEPRASSPEEFSTREKQNGNPLKHVLTKMGTVNWTIAERQRASDTRPEHHMQPESLAAMLKLSW